MQNDSRYDINDRVNSFRSAVNKFSSEEPFHGTFQPTNYSVYPDNRSFEKFLNSKQLEDSKRNRDTQSFDIRSRSSLGFDKSPQQSSQYFHERNNSETILNQQDKLNKLESILCHKESIIDDLKYQKNAMSKEIDDLILRIKDKDFQRDAEISKYNSKIEEYKYQSSENEEFIRTLQEELEKCQQKYEEYKSRPSVPSKNEEYSALLNENKSLKSTIDSLTQHTKHLENQLNSKPDPSTSRSEFTIFKLQEQIKQLQESNENLSMALNTRPTFKDIKDKEIIISELKDKINHKSSRSRSTSQTRDQNRESIRKDKELHNLPLGELPSVATMNVLFTEVLNILKLQNFNEIVPTIKKLKKKCKSSDLEEKISKLVRDLSPEGSYHPAPSPSQI